MPVIDHEIHESVKINADDPYGCSNREGFAEGYYAPNRYYREDGTYREEQVFVPHRTSTSCRNFYLWGVDPRCAVCKADKDVEYAEVMGNLSA